MRNQLEQVIKRYTEADSITEEMELQRDLGLDSFTVTNIVVSLEDCLQIEIPISEAADFVTVGDIEAYLEEACCSEKES